MAISGDMPLKIEGNLKNQGLIQNNGRVFITGNYENTGTISGQSGSFVLLSNTTQSISTNGVALQTLELRGSGNKILSGNTPVIINTSLLIRSGIVVSDENNYIIMGPEATIVADPGTYIQGPLFHQGTGNKFYPLGDNGTATNVELINVTGSSDLLTGIELMEETFVPVESNGINSIYNQRFWKRTILNGEFSSGKIQLPLLGDESILNPDDMVVLTSDNKDGPYFSIGSDEPNPDYIVSDESVNRSFIAIGEVTVFDPSEFVIKNLITLNNDNLNEWIYVENIENYSINSIKLMNRLGIEVWSTNNYTNELVESAPVEIPPGSYVCVLEFTDAEGKEITRTQMITVVR